MFCVLPVFDNGIDVLDWGYSSIEQLLDAWNDTKFENACMLTFFFPGILLDQSNQTPSIFSLRPKRIF
jgi:hypothetical protein